MRRFIVIALVLLGVPTAAADAAPRTIPYGFYGAGYGGNVELLHPGTQGAVWNQLAMGGAESARVMFNWELAQRTSSDPALTDWSLIDPLVIAAVQRNMEILPIVEYAPSWAKKYPGRAASPPKNPADYTAFLGLAIKRYGPNGAFWKAHPELPPKPIRQWEIWNEPEIAFHWHREPFSRPWGKSDALEYVALLRASRSVIKRLDPGAKVVAAALSINSWTNLTKLYDWTAIEGQFDVAAVQAYAGQPSFIPTILGNFRKVLDGHGAKNVPIYVTEMTWPAAQGKANPKYARTGYMKGFLTDQAGQAKRLTEAYKLLRDSRAKWKLQRVYWYTGASSYTTNNEYEYSGLLTYQQKLLPSYFAYRKSAQAVQGCAKTARGTCK